MTDRVRMDLNRYCSRYPRCEFALEKWFYSTCHYYSPSGIIYTFWSEASWSEPFTFYLGLQSCPLRLYRKKVLWLEGQKFTVKVLDKTTGTRNRIAFRTSRFNCRKFCAWWNTRRQEQFISMSFLWKLYGPIRFFFPWWWIFFSYVLKSVVKFIPVYSDVW